MSRAFLFARGLHTLLLRGNTQPPLHGEGAVGDPGLGLSGLSQTPEGVAFVRCLTAARELLQRQEAWGALWPGSTGPHVCLRTSGWRGRHSWGPPLLIGEEEMGAQI